MDLLPKGTEVRLKPKLLTMSKKDRGIGIIDGLALIQTPSPEMEDQGVIGTIYVVQFGIPNELGYTSECIHEEYLELVK